MAAHHRCLLGCRSPSLPRPSFSGRSTHRPRRDAPASAVQPSRPGWYEEFYASAMDQGMKSYEAEIAGYKAKLFSQLSPGRKNILELGVGTGPSFKYYASEDGVSVIGVDPNKHMENYARAAAVSAGLSSSSFTFRRGVAEALPADNHSMDAMMGTLVLCYVNNIDMAHWCCAL